VGAQRRRWYTKAEVAATYDAQRFRGPIGSVVNRLEKSSLRRALGRLPRRERTLEVACGSGRMTRVLLESGYPTVATDISAAMIAEARHALPADARFRGYALCDSSHLPFGADSFDALVSFRFLAHLPTRVRAQVLAEVARVTRTSVVLSAQTPWSLKFLYRYLFRLRDPIDPPYALSPRALGREAARVGLRLASIHHSLRFVAETYVGVFEKPAAG
jgi:ubiquinone/menaquinone biosynthesis C-methylase UbiE